MNLKTRLRSTFMRRLSSASFQQAQQNKARKQRERRGEPPAVLYFHQVDDPYSQLAVQKLDQLRARYRLAFRPYLVSAPEPEYQGAAEHFARWAWTDAASVARAYGTDFAPSVRTPAPAAIEQANAALAPHLEQDDFAQLASEVGTALWTGRTIGAGPATGSGAEAVRAGNALRKSLGHYQGGMFHFDGEWYWGIDRLRLLEQRLQQEGFAAGDGLICVPEPTPTDTSGLQTANVSLDYFPSLRSPYTAIGHQRVLDLIARSGVTARVRPVMPMMMRGIPAPSEKGRYILTDAAREGRAHGSPLGRIVDPFGEPVKRAFTLYPAADAAGRGMEFVTAYLQAAWVDGLDITTERGLRRVVANAGLDWQSLQQATRDTDWEAILQANLQVMLDHDLWGVPSFRVSGRQQRKRFRLLGTGPDLARRERNRQESIDSARGKHR